MNLQMEFTADTAVKIAEYFEKSGYITEANRLWMEINHISAYDRDLRAKLGEFHFRIARNTNSNRDVLRSALYSSVDVDLVPNSYDGRRRTSTTCSNCCVVGAKLSQPGNVILGLGTGRCGSTTLSAAFGGVPDICATHENPPHIFWEPIEEQVRFHLDRLRMLADYFPLVFDAAHWWLNVVSSCFDRIPHVQVDRTGARDGNLRAILPQISRARIGIDEQLGAAQ